MQSPGLSGGGLKGSERWRGLDGGAGCRSTANAGSSGHPPFVPARPTSGNRRTPKLGEELPVLSCTSGCVKPFGTIRLSGGTQRRVQLPTVTAARPACAAAPMGPWVTSRRHGRLQTDGGPLPPGSPPGARRRRGTRAPVRLPQALLSDPCLNR